MEQYVSQVLLEVNGQSIDDFKSITEDARIMKKPVKLMNKTGTARVKPEYGLQVEYVIPKNKPEFDFEEVEDGTLTIDYENGTRIQYTGVDAMEIGETKYDGENEATRTIKMTATKRTK